MLQFHNEFITVELVNQGTAIALTWKGFVPSTSYREAMEKALEIAKKHKIHNWISDIKLVKVLGIKDQEWCGTDWTPRAVLSGCYRKQAVIMPADVFGHASTQNIITKMQNQQIEIQYFTQLEEAKKWLAATHAPVV